MNRHAPLFQVAFLSLLMAVSLPLLVYAAAQVRHRQLQSTANPRWSKFKEVNGPRSTAETTASSTSVPPAATAAPRRTEVRTVSQSAGLTGSATGSLPATPQPATAAISRRHAEPSPAAAKPNTLSALQTEAVPPSPTTVNVPVPVPDDLPPGESAPVQPPRTAYRPKVEFRAVDESKMNDAASHRIEAQLAGMQRRLDQLAQAQTGSQMSDLERALNLLRQAQQVQQNQARQFGLQDLPAGNPAALVPQPAPAAAPPVSAPPAAAPPAPQTPAPGGTSKSASNGGPGREPTIKILQGDAGDADERFSIQVHEANLTEVLEMLGMLAGVNILTSKDVQGQVSLNLVDVTVDAALDAILKSQGFVHERDGDFIYVRSVAEAAALQQANRKLVTKVYQLHYVAAAELQKLIDPVLTKGVGRQGVTTPAQTGIAPMPTSAGGDGLAGRDTLLVQDYPEVIAEVDKIVIELDVPPLQVMIEAKILSVVLSDSMAFGVNFAMLNGAQNSQVLSGNGSTLNGAVGFPASASLVPAAGDFIANTAGLKYGFIQGDVSGFIKALETIADTTLVAAPQLRVLNKQKAEMIIGERLSYKTLAFNGTQTVENVQFLDAGTKLIFRPFISPDGLVRLEVHPERSKATINESTGLPNSETTEVTTNVMVRDGTTVVLGGLISEESTESIERVPLLGAIPVVGAAFRNKTEKVQRNELIVLITPRIVTEPEAAIEGEKLQFETSERAAFFRDNLSAVNRTSLTRAHYERACEYFERGNLLKARQQIDAALQQNKGDLECQRLRLKIDQALRDQQSRVWRWPLGNRSAGR